MESFLHWDHSSKAKLTLEQKTLRAILSLFTTLSLTMANGQDIKSVPESSTIDIKRIKAIHSANTFLEAKYTSEEVSKRFVADSFNSLIVCEDYKTFFTSKYPYCLPFGYEIGFHILLNKGNSWDTLHSRLFLPLDSSFSVLKDSLEDVWHHGYFDAWAKVITNKYRINYSDVLRFIVQKDLSDFSIEFGYETKRPKKKYKFYWFVSGRERKKKGEPYISYQINPITGIVARRKMPLLEVLDDAHKRR